MSIIKKPFNKKRLKETISFLSPDAKAQYIPTDFVHNLICELIPLKYKTYPESYILEEDKEILGMISVFFHRGNPLKISIGRLFLSQTPYEVGKKLVDYVVAKYGAKGASNFIVKIEDTENELLNLFSDGCGFRQCLSEQIWALNGASLETGIKSFFRPFKNSDAKSTAELYNDTLITHFRPSLFKEASEFEDSFFNGLQSSYTIKYVLEEPETKKIIAYLKISSNDNENFLLDITSSAWHDCSYEDILSFARKQVARRTKNFNLFVRVKKYKVNGEAWGEYLKQKGFEFVENKIVLVKDFHKIIKEAIPAKRFVLFDEILSKPAFKV